MISPYDMRDALDGLSVNIAWQHMVTELRRQQDAIVRSMVAETTSPDERARLATEYRAIETFISWPDQFRQELEGMQE